MLVTRAAVGETGPFVDDYFIYYEDTDWCWRMKQAGYELWSVPDATALHDASSSLGMESARFHYLRTRNRLWFFGRYGPGPLWRRRWTILKHVLAHSFYPEARAGDWAGAVAVLRGYAAGLRPPPALRRPPPGN
jgi:GT2 family glycosyltransferase